MAAILRSQQTFVPDEIPEVEYTSKIAISIPDILSFWSTLPLKYWWVYTNFKIDLLCDLVTSSATSWIRIYVNVVIISYEQEV